MINPRMEELSARQLNMSDMDEIIAFRKRVSRGVFPMDIDMSGGSQEQMIERLIAEEGVSLGSFFRGKLISYSAMGFAPVAAPATDFFSLTASTDQRVAALAMCVVDAEFRDMGLHSYFIRQRQRLAIELGYTHICALTSAYGVSSWSNLLKQDMAISGLKRMPKSGRYKYFLFGDLHSPFTPEDGQIIYVDSNDFEVQKNLLTQGFVAVKRVDAGEKKVLCFER